MTSILLSSCNDEAETRNSKTLPKLTKEERMELFLESPITLNTNVTEQRLNTIQFHKSYILNENPHNANSDSLLRANSNSYVVIGEEHFDKERDSLIRFASATDVIEVLKNKYVERVTYMRLQSEGLQLNYSMHLGMDADSFTKLFPLEIDANYKATIEEHDAFEVTFTFDQTDKTLKEVHYVSVMD
ncbi:hypothetical protein ES711_04165 [Gelidibacter salicanalis]|uniref:Uncharacterized protein n=1 Tax=Gelidibacter salicanalis TaxID=291193 RepID=A0A5C7ARL0_9FLAO|nr:hypothetical protein ES711_04165 [Gelidibacter salicanalis]